MLGIPIDRIVAFFGPLVSLIAGGIAAWLIAKVNITGVKGLDQANLETYISGGLSFGLATVVTWLGHSKWLTGRHIEMQGEFARAVASIHALASPGGRSIPLDLANSLGMISTSAAGAGGVLRVTKQPPPPPGVVPADLSTHGVYGAPAPPAPAAAGPQYLDDDSQDQIASTDGDAQAPVGPTFPEEA